MTAAAAPPRLPLRSRARAYRGSTRAGLGRLLVYRSDFAVGALGVLMQVFLMRVVWTAVFPASGAAQATGGQHITLSEQIAYSTLAAVQYSLVAPAAVTPAVARVRDGTVAFDLVRPVGFQGQMIAQQLGGMLGSLPFALLALPFAVLVGGARPPASAGAALAYVAALALGGLVALLVSALIGTVAFWTTEIGGMLTIYQVVTQFLAGALVPLWFMPGWLGTLASWLPFQGTTYTPVAVYLGKLGGTAEVLRALGMQAAWALVLAGAVKLVWARALRRLTVQGG